MQNIKVSAYTLLVLLSVLIFHILGMAEHLYIRFWFYDIFMHILGGMGIAMSVYCVILFLKRDNIKNDLWKMLLLVLAAGLSWELFEVYFNIAGSRLWTTPYYIDTVKDLINDMIGAIIVIFIIKKQIK